MSLGVLFSRDCEDEEVQFDADSFMDTVGNLLGEEHCCIASLNVFFCLLLENLGEKKSKTVEPFHNGHFGDRGKRGRCREVAVLWGK